MYFAVIYLDVNSIIVLGVPEISRFLTYKLVPSLDFPCTTQSFGSNYCNQGE